jgi:hypothetical protein
MLTLLKQARAFGIGIILVTQNPVDLDYKGLSNCGTWFIGKLQTERDKARVLEGLKAASNGEIDGNTLDKMIAMTGNRIFILRSVYKKDPLLFQTRWTLSYLRGPLTLAQIATLSDKSAIRTQKPAPAQKTGEKPTIPSSVQEYFLKTGKEPVHYQPRVLGIGKVHFVDAKNKVDVWQEICVAAPSENDGKSVDWEKGTVISQSKEYLGDKPDQDSTFEGLPSGLMEEKTYRSLEKIFAGFLYQNQIFSIFRISTLDMVSTSGESESDFRLRAAQALREKYEEQVKKVQEKYADKRTSITNKIQRAQSKLTVKQEKAGTQKLQTFISIGATLLGTMFGKGLTKGAISQTGSTLRRASQMGKESRQAADAEEEVKGYRQQLSDLDIEMNGEIAALSMSHSPENIPLEKFSIHPKKNDISIEKIALLWCA